jgi:hypothetical protein
MSSGQPLQTVHDMSSVAVLRQMIGGYRMTQALYVAAKLNIADLLREQPKTSDELASALGVHPDLLHRVLRRLTSVGIFAEQEQGGYTLTPLSALLQSSAPGALWAEAIVAGEWFGRAWGELLSSVQTGTPGFERAFGMPFFAYLAQHADAAAVYNALVGGRTLAEATEIPTVYDFSGGHTLVDVGGGRGAFLATILGAYPHLRGRLFDQAAVLQEARSVLETAGVAERCDLVAGDFFESVPAGRNLYVLKRVLHDWDDARVIRLLTNCHHAMQGQGKLLVIESITPPNNAPSSVLLGDLGMFLLYGGRERTEAEYRTLLAAAGFTVTNVIPTSSPPWNPWSVIESVPR